MTGRVATRIAEQMGPAGRVEACWSYANGREKGEDSNEGSWPTSANCADSKTSDNQYETGQTEPSRTHRILRQSLLPPSLEYITFVIG